MALLGLLGAKSFTSDGRKVLVEMEYEEKISPEIPFIMLFSQIPHISCSSTENRTIFNIFTPHMLVFILFYFSYNYSC